MRFIYKYQLLLVAIFFCEMNLQYYFLYANINNTLRIKFPIGKKDVFDESRKNYNFSDVSNIIIMNYLK